MDSIKDQQRREEFEKAEEDVYLLTIKTRKIDGHYDHEICGLGRHPKRHELMERARTLSEDLYDFYAKNGEMTRMDLILLRDNSQPGS